MTTTYLYDISKGKKNTVIEFINDKFTTNRLQMQEQHRSWMLNLAWVRGFQNYDFDSLRKSWQGNTRDKNFEAWRVRLISNIMLPVVRRVVSQMTYVHPIWDVIPATPDEEDIEIASVSTKVLQDAWQRLDMSMKIVRLLYWQTICSNAYFKIGWDPDEGDEITVATKDMEKDLAMQYLQSQGIEIMPPEVQVQKGSDFIDIRPPFNITLEETANVLQESEWIIDSEIRSLDWIASKFGNKYKTIKESENAELFLYPKLNGFNNQTRQKRNNGVLVHELFIKKCKKFKKGMHCIMAGDMLLVPPEDSPYDHGELPYSHFLEIYDPASVHGTCVAEQIRPQQARYNRVASGIMEQVNQMSKNQWLNPKNSGVKEFTNRPGGVINYNYPYEPKQVDLKPIPGYVERFLDRTKLEIQDTASTHDVSEGKAEPGVRSGRAVLALQDADDGILGPTVLWFDESLGRTGRLLLQTIIQYSDYEKTVQVTGEFNELQTVSFSSENLTGKASNGNYWKVRVKTYGRQILSRSGREQLVNTLIEQGLLNPQIHREELLNILGAADILSVYDGNKVDRTRQYNEIQMMIQKNQPVPVYPGQNHLLHIDVIRKYMSGSKWDKLKEEQKMLIVGHFTEHTKAQVQEAIFPQIYASSIAGGVQLNGGGTSQGQNRSNGQAQVRTQGRR